ncbi:TPA: hypothetical protein IZ494_002795 [Enterococcus faecium]|nr:hypothetical protein [Enterococcus faecium]
MDSKTPQWFTSHSGSIKLYSATEKRRLSDNKEVAISVVVSGNHQK